MEIITEKKKWNQVVRGFKVWDPAHEWGYFEAHQYREKNIRPILFYSKSEYGQVAYPFFLVNNEEKNRITRTLNAVYGYTGPLIDEKDQRVWQLFTEEFKVFCEKNEVTEINERFHPLLKNNRKIFPTSEIRLNKKVIVVETDKKPKEVFEGYKNSNVRRMIKKSKKENILIKRSELQDKDFESFLTLYNQSMDRLKAPKIYHFEKDFLIKLCEEFKDRFWLTLAYVQEEVVGAEITLVSPSCAYPFLLGTNPMFNKFGVAQRLYYELQGRCFEEGIPYAILGGGRGKEEDDSLLKFKKGFLNKKTQDQEILPYFIGKTTL